MTSLRSQSGVAAATTDLIADNPRTPLTLRLNKVRAEVIQGPDRGASVEVGARRVVIGRSSGCDLVLTDQTVSAMHVELALEPNGVLVRNLGSRNGVHAGSTRIEEGVVDLGTPLLLGRSVLRMQPMEEQAEVPFAPVRRTGSLVGASLKMKIVFGLLRQYAAADAPVLIEGETGTGKELAAHAIHDLSPHAQGPYEVVDCGAIPERLVDAELFGACKGGYPGVDEPRPGVFERASGGTVVLDEIGELPVAVQQKLLGLLERGQVRRVGEDFARKVSVRVIATTNRVLAREVQAGRFRQDLFFRLTVLRLTIPPLRDRKEDIPLLVDEILGARHGFPAQWLHALTDHSWPGNVRELRNALVRAQAHARRHGTEAPIDLLVGGEGPVVEDMETARRRFERDYLKSLLTKSGHNVARAARLAGMTRQGLYRLLHRHGLGPTRAQPPAGAAMPIGGGEEGGRSGSA
ncbi:MAG TPA: sigma 54-interacting transcriptional regulator [Polyangia bacterium]|nr:sigma 54-interacting transcriptional regulator [Polyangia bacterium]